MENRITDNLTPAPLGAWRFEGFLGGRVDRAIDSRIASEFARREIHPELVEAFRARVDDRLRPGGGMWQGEFWGKWILSAVAACRYRGDENLKAFIARSAADILATQDPDGYIGTYHDPSFIMNRGKGVTWAVWTRKYTLWGLMEAWELLGDDRILNGAVRMTDHLMTQVGPCKTDIIRTGKLFGLPSTSILKPIVMLARATNEARHLSFCEYIVDQWSRHPDGPPDILRKGLGGAPVHTWFSNPYDWAKSYEFLSCVEGLLDLHRLTGNADYLKAARNIHRNLAMWERSPVGSVSFNDKSIGNRRIINTAGELCDVVYWNRVSFDLLRLTGEPRYADEIERALYNALLGGMNPEATWGLRRLRLSHEHIPAHHHCQMRHQQCCVANSPRGLLQAAEAAFLTDERGVLCALYNPGRGSVTLPSGRAAALSIEGDYPAEGAVRLVVSPEEPESFALRLRIPEWSCETKVSVNGEAAPAPRAGSWLSLERTWRAGDCVALNLDMRTRAERFDASELPADDPLVAWSATEWAKMANMEPGAPPHMLTTADALPHRDSVALLRGPLVLARDVRLGQESIFSPLPAGFDPGQPGELRRTAPPAGVWLAFELPTARGPLALCDFASAGNTWDSRSRFNTWLAL
ncbi:MAG: glycoside hydrolase family 127 protein [Candidatus Sumerlaeota bacterium]|nr:glycoside hydrolase family 127 protein [Candidatus Sumerlaeota bacterium]